VSGVTLNDPDGSLPYGLKHPDPTVKLLWMCNYGMEGSEIVSVFAESQGDKTKKEPKYLRGMDEARSIRDELLKNGWVPMKTPEIKIRTDPASSSERFPEPRTPSGGKKPRKR